MLPAQLDKKSDWIDNLIIHYTHEARLYSCKKDIHRLWNEIFQQTSVMSTRLIVGNRNSRNVKKTLANTPAFPTQIHVDKNQSDRSKVTNIKNYT